MKCCRHATAFGSDTVACPPSPILDKLLHHHVTTLGKQCSSGNTEVVRITDNLQTNPAAHVSVFSDIGPSSEFRAWPTVIAGFLYKQARNSELGPRSKLGIPSLVHSHCRVSLQASSGFRAWSKEQARNSELGPQSLQGCPKSVLKQICVIQYWSTVFAIRKAFISNLYYSICGKRVVAKLLES